MQRYDGMVKISTATVLAALLAAPAVAQAGTTGGVCGDVVSDDGLPVAGVTVKAESPSAEKTHATDSRGIFCFMSLAPDHYFILFNAEGFNSEAMHADVHADQNLWRHATLYRGLKSLPIFPPRRFLCSLPLITPS